jgi:hypothetical protein
MISPPRIQIHYIYDIFINNKLMVWFRFLVGFIVTLGGVLSRLAYAVRKIVDTSQGD